MAKQELFKHPLRARFLTARRGARSESGSPTRAALKATRAALEAGEPVAVFPGRDKRVVTVAIADLFDGTAYLAVTRGADRPGGHRGQ